jgi:type IV secretion system protein VirB9
MNTTRRITPPNLTLAVVLALLAPTACATGAPEPEPVFIEAAVVEPEPEPEPLIVGVPYAVPAPGQAVPWPEETGPTPAEIEAARSQGEAGARSPADVIEQANELARRAPTPEGFTNATHVYDYMPGRLYGAWGAPNHLTTLSFAPGEEVISYGLGDTVRWLVEKTYSGSGAERHTLLVLEPRQRGLHTTMVVTTSIGTYHFELRSFQHTYLASVSFRHPRARLVRLERERRERLSATAAGGDQGTERTRGAAGGDLELAVDLSELEDRYRFVVPDASSPPRWMPRRVFHDGLRTYLVFDRELGDRELPVVAVYSRTKKPRLVQTTVRGRYMIVGEVVERGMLRVGKEHYERVGFELAREARR